MPVVFRQGGFRFHFYSDEGDPLEPVHIHVAARGADAKFWLFPAVELAYNRGFSAHTLRRLKRSVEEHRADIQRAWDEHFG
jgi:hypothetical protein